MFTSISVGVSNLPCLITFCLWFPIEVFFLALVYVHAVLLPLGFTPDVKLWNVQFTKAGDYHQVTKAMGLTGHRNCVYHCSLSADSTRYVCVRACVHVYVHPLNGIDDQVQTNPNLFSVSCVKGLLQYLRMAVGNYGTLMVR